jgi:hypothetical protein
MGSDWIDGINAFGMLGQGPRDTARSAAHVEDNARLVYNAFVEDGEGFWQVGGTQMIAIYHALILKAPGVMLVWLLFAGKSE